MLQSMAAIGTGIPAASVLGRCQEVCSALRGCRAGPEEAKDAALAWEQQAQGALQQLDSLKDILEESAAWSGAQPCSWQCFMLGSITPPPCCRVAGCLGCISWQQAAASGHPGAVMSVACVSLHAQHSAALKQGPLSSLHGDSGCLDRAGGQVEERPQEEPGGSQLAGEESAASEADGERSLEKRYLQVRHITSAPA